MSLNELARYPFMRSSSNPGVSSAISPEFAHFWDSTEPVATCTWTPMLKRLIIAGKGVSCFSKIAFIDELARGEVVWRPLDIPAMNQMQVGIIVPSHRALQNVTHNFVGGMARRLQQLEATAAAF